ncbi:hypothetical protein M9H77_32676 [Catharanthus roseus]|uniref:Uncharacterized protein n=1 Tax=Catharanthus roseus TaxID=4058 RepID=A0ACC0A4G6_CATRO|nr:hypothetical protein M9H77_32676 [Catharanthus roseus]
MVALKVIERCRVAPPPGTVADAPLSLTSWDAIWLNFHPCTCILFYKFQRTKTHFIDSYIPKLKQSLSLTLKHYFPPATNLIFISLILAESSDDFNYLIENNHLKNCDRFYSLIPKIPPPFSEFRIEKTPLWISITTNYLSENSNKVRATFIMHQIDIKNLKIYVLSKRPNAIHISSWTVTCAYLWICWLKSLEAIGEKVDETENQYLFYSINYQARLYPPLPITYLETIVESDGLINAAVSIGEAIHTSINVVETVWNGTGLWQGGSLFIQGSRNFQSAVEIGLSLEQKRMDAFATIFNTHLSYCFGKSNLGFNPGDVLLYSRYKEAKIILRYFQILFLFMFLEYLFNLNSI